MYEIILAGSSWLKLLMVNKSISYEFVREWPLENMQAVNIWVKLAMFSNLKYSLLCMLGDYSMIILLNYTFFQ
jgi:hypothetical protein